MVVLASANVSNDESQLISYLKAFAAILVVLVHAKPYMSEAVINPDLVYGTPMWMVWVNESFFYTVGTLLANVCNPLFFFCSGYLYYVKKPSYARNIRRKLRTLLVPFFVWNTFWIATVMVLRGAGAPFLGGYADTSALTVTQVAGWYLGIDGLYPFEGALWFLPGLFVLNLLEPAVRVFLNRVPKTSFVALIGIWLFVFRRFFWLSSAGVFFYLAWYVVELRPGGGWRLGQVAGAKIHALGLTCILLAGATLIVRRLPLALPLSYLCVNLLQRMVTVGVLPLTIILVARYLDSAHRTTWLSKYFELSFIIYVGHEFVTRVGRSALKSLVGNAFILIPAYVVLALLALLLPMAVGMMLRRRVPRVYSFLTGGGVMREGL